MFHERNPALARPLSESEWRRPSTQAITSHPGSEAESHDIIAAQPKFSAIEVWQLDRPVNREP
jgi:hypothetical protein